MKFHENPSSGSRGVLCGWTDGQADVPKLYSFTQGQQEVAVSCEYIRRVFSGVRRRLLTCKELFELVTDRKQKVNFKMFL